MRAQCSAGGLRHRRDGTPDRDLGGLQARNVASEPSERTQPVKFLMRDGATKLTESLDGAFCTKNVRVIRTPIDALRANPSPTASSALSVGSISIGR
jgi:hypothetical protein